MNSKPCKHWMLRLSARLVFGALCVGGGAKRLGDVCEQGRHSPSLRESGTIYPINRFPPPLAACPMTDDLTIRNPDQIRQDCARKLRQVESGGPNWAEFGSIEIHSLLID
jgi:hypothetical protein